jgi:hypothetical protein
MSASLAVNLSQSKDVDRTKTGKKRPPEKRGCKKQKDEWSLWDKRYRRVRAGLAVSRDGSDERAWGASEFQLRTKHEEADYSSIAPLIFRRCSRKV